MHNIRLHLRFIRLSIAQRMAYRADFFASFFAYFLWQFVAPLVVLTAYYAGGTFPGWTVEQVLVLQGVVALIQGFTSMLLFGIVWNTNHHVRNGTLDLLLLRPVNSLWLLVMDSFDAEDMGMFFGGIVLLSLGVSLNGGFAGSIPLFIILALLGVLFFFSLALLFSAITVRVIQTMRLYEFLTIIGIFAKYPRTLYGRSVALAFTVALPLFIAAHYPAAALLGLDLSGVAEAVVATIILFCLSLWFWHHTMRHYVSAGG